MESLIIHPHIPYISTLSHPIDAINLQWCPNKLIHNTLYIIILLSHPIDTINLQWCPIYILIGPPLSHTLWRWAMWIQYCISSMNERLCTRIYRYNVKGCKCTINMFNIHSFILLVGACKSVTLLICNSLAWVLNRPINCMPISKRFHPLIWFLLVANQFLIRKPWPH